MKLFLAATVSRERVVRKYRPLYVLESFCYIKPWQVQELPNWKMFLLDSGAFTFMSGKSEVNWDSYLSRYIEFINTHNIQYFFELDIDSIIGYERVKEIRTRLENETGKQCIPVWHRERGLEEFKTLCQEYDYIAIGGMAIKDIKPNEFPVLKKFVQLAAQYGTKVHGLGFTPRNADSYGFYSVDSSAWISSARYGGIDYFDGKIIRRITTPKGKKAIDYKIRDEFALQEWIKYQKYLNVKGK